MSYPGGKSGAGVYQTIINQIPPHRVLVVPFAGHCGVARRMRPARQVIAIDRHLSALALWQPGTTASPDDAAGVTATPDGGRPHLVCGCGIAFLDSYPWRGDELVYADPPYLLETRSTPRRYYQHELFDADPTVRGSGTAGRIETDRAAHSRLLEVLRRLPCKVALSGYRSDLYRSALAGWRMITFRAQTRRGSATECLWMNYPEPTALHDYAHLGGDYRERERIKRKGNRWLGKYRHLPHLERQAILSRLLAAEAALAGPHRHSRR